MNTLFDTILDLGFVAFGISVMYSLTRVFAAMTILNKII